MSVTFTIEANPTGAYVADCYDTGTHLSADSYDGILLEIAAHKLTCELCAAYGLYSRAVMDVDDEGVNLANANALMVLAILGYDDLAGSDTAENFVGRALVALAEDRDGAPVPAIVMPRATDDEGNPIGATLHLGGLPANYTTDTITLLHDLAAEAARLGRDITWS